MVSLLDAIGATVTGTLLLLIIMTAFFNMQAISQNTKMQINLTQISEDLITGRKIGDKDFYGIDTYLTKVGAGVPEETDPIIEASPTGFKFLAQMTPGAALSTFYFTQGIETSEGIPLYVYQDDMTNPIFGPFWMADDLSLTYYDENDNDVQFPELNHELIRSVEVNLTFFYETYRPDIDNRFVRYKVVFWKYFKNLYI